MDVNTVSYAAFIDHLFGRSPPTWLGGLYPIEDDLQASPVGARLLARLFHTASSSLTHIPECSLAPGLDAIIEEGWLNVFCETRIPWPDRRAGINGIVPLVAGFLASPGAGEARARKAWRLCHHLAWGYHGRGPEDADDALIQTELLHAFMSLLRLRTTVAAESAATDGLMYLNHAQTVPALEQLFATGWTPIDPHNDRYLATLIYEGRRGES